MKRTLGHAALAALLLLGVAALPTRASASAPRAGTTATRLLADVPSGLRAAVDHGPMNRGQLLRIGVVIHNPNAAAKRQAFDDLYNPSSPAFHRFVTPAEFNRRFGVDPAVTTAVRSVVTKHGMRLEFAASDGGYLIVRGPVNAIESVFDTHLHRFTRADGSSFFANVDRPTVPGAVDALVGLTDIVKIAPLAANANGPDTDPATPAQKSNRFCGFTHPDACYGTLIPEDLWGVYDAPKTDFGTGIKVGIYGEENPNLVFSDLRHYEAIHHLPQVPVHEILTNANVTGTNAPIEANLDVDAVQGMAPNVAELDLYFDDAVLSPADLGATFYKWANAADGPPIMNVSYGLCEPAMVALGWPQALEAPLQQAAMEGRTAFVATGDTGGSCGAGQVNGLGNAVVPSVNYPASSAYAVGVGGTVVMTKNTATFSADEAWPPARALEIAWTHGGGGHSVMEPEPGYQRAVAPLSTRCVLTHDAGGVDTKVSPCRNVPDVAAMSGDVVFNTYDIYSGGQETGGAGTSLSAPLWAGLWARVLAAHDNATCAPFGARAPGAIGFANPSLYAVGANAQADAAAFTDITVGTNGQNVALGRSAVNRSGYDNVTGLGAPDVGGLLRLLDCGRTTPLAASNPVQPTDHPILDAAPACGVQSDPAGDATLAGELGLSGPNELDEPAVDLTSVKMTSDALSLTFTDRVVNLSSTSRRIGFEHLFSFEGVDADVIADRGPSGKPPHYSLNTVDPATLQLTRRAVLTGYFDRFHNTVTVRLPYSLFNQLRPAHPLGVGSTLNDVHVGAGYVTAISSKPANDAQYVGLDYADFACPYAVGR